MHRAALSGALMKGLVMPVFSVDTQAVADTASRTRTRIATIQTETDGLKGDISLLQSSWTGGASDSMATCAADWHVTAIQVQSSLDLISQALDHGRDPRRRAEGERATRVAGFDITHEAERLAHRYRALAEW